jgi:hypothetical protein
VPVLVGSSLEAQPMRSRTAATAPICSTNDARGIFKAGPRPCRGVRILGVGLLLAFFTLDKMISPILITIGGVSCFGLRRAVTLFQAAHLLKLVDRHPRP